MSHDPLSHVAAWLAPVRAEDPAAIDPVIGMIAEAKRLSNLGCTLQTKADAIFFALHEDGRRAYNANEITLPADCIELYQRAAELGEQSNVIFDRICATKPITAAGAIAMLELDEVDPDEIRLRVIEYLADLQ